MSEQDTFGFRIQAIETQQQHICRKLDEIHEAVIILKNKPVVEPGKAMVCEQHTNTLSEIAEKVRDLEEWKWKSIGAIGVIVLVVSVAVKYISP